jgi:hypothetical protein
MRREDKMGRKARDVRAQTRRRIRSSPLTENERRLLAKSAYEGSPQHKRSPGDFGLPPRPRRDATLCDEAGVTTRAEAEKLFSRGIERGLVSVATAHGGFPKQIWVVDEEGRVFEGMYGGSQAGYYHGYPIREVDPLHDEVLRAWGLDS